MKLYIGADHAGFYLKEGVKKFLDKKNIAYEDLGNKVLDMDDDYPDFSYLVAKAVAGHKNSLGILFCGSAQGAGITANKVKGVRAGSARNPAEAKLAREHDDLNVLCLPGGAQVQTRVKGQGVKPAEAEKIILSWLSGNFPEAPRHKRRVDKIKAIEKKNFK